MAIYCVKFVLKYQVVPLVKLFDLQYRACLGEMLAKISKEASELLDKCDIQT